VHILTLIEPHNDHSPKVVQQRSAQMELEDNRRQVQELSQTKKQLQAEVNDLKDRLDSELISKKEEAGKSYSRDFECL
jgi:cell division protein FtsB